MGRLLFILWSCGLQPYCVNWKYILLASNLSIISISLADLRLLSCKWVASCWCPISSIALTPISGHNGFKQLSVSEAGGRLPLANLSRVRCWPGDWRGLCSCSKHDVCKKCRIFVCPVLVQYCWHYGFKTTGQVRVGVAHRRAVALTEIITILLWFSLLL